MIKRYAHAVDVRMSRLETIERQYANMPTSALGGGECKSPWHNSSGSLKFDGDREQNHRLSLSKNTIQT